MLTLDSQKISSPGFSEFGVVVEGGSEVLHIEVEFSLVFLLDVGDGHDSGGLLVDQLSESFLV